MTIVTVGIDLTKNVFAVHGVDETGKPALVRPEVPRTKLLELIAMLLPCLIGSGTRATWGPGCGVHRLSGRRCKNIVLLKHSHSLAHNYTSNCDPRTRCLPAP